MRAVEDHHIALESFTVSGACYSNDLHDLIIVNVTGFSGRSPHGRCLRLKTGRCYRLKPEVCIEIFEVPLLFISSHGRQITALRI